MVFGGPAFDPKKIPDLAGKVILITGANGGLGYESLLHLAPHNPAKIYLCARSQAKYDAAMKGITAAVPNAASMVKYLELDLTSLASVKSAAQTFLNENSRLDILMNNAGIMATPAALTKDGYEIQFGTNHMGHFLLTKLLLPTLQSTASATPDADVRIINLTSDGHSLAPRNAGFVPDAVRTDMQDYSTWTRYGQSKLANILFTRELARRHPDITSVAIHPGGVATNLANSFTDSHRFLSLLLVPVLKAMTAKPSVGALNQTWACVAPVQGRKVVGGGSEKEIKSGGYYVPVAKPDVGSKFANDAELARKLWEWSEEDLERQGY
ncbi:hypothetical protein EPUS_01281 [Endocarpon pusillum Z07020]|uniref:Oxidoreductase n=1 Tax=Endocarpon pusillum (strain Z07020 / HMAS-L-300199) TaxID=1263415 RepID=U1HYG7_ENDPU|nr:uncharacterized protein EPUS_01281 [Endocarpon pusillum Z07020]ERF75915.1 hypothetical protein EPUS_01281 [Endocarpon pusillum Z07020]